MKVLFLQNIKNGPRVGDIKDVADGYARNFLFPNEIASMADRDSVKQSERLKATHVAELTAQKADAEKLATKMSDVSITIEAEANPEGSLYGSIGQDEIASRLTQEGYAVSEDMVELGAHIKEIGEYTIKLALHPEVFTTIKLVVSAKKSE